MPANVDQFERAAAEIAHDTIGFVNARCHAERGELCLARAGQNFDGATAEPLGFGNKRRAIGRVAAGGSGNRM